MLATTSTGKRTTFSFLRVWVGASECSGPFEHRWGSPWRTSRRPQRLPGKRFDQFVRWVLGFFWVVSWKLKISICVDTSWMRDGVYFFCIFAPIIFAAFLGFLGWHWMANGVKKDNVFAGFSNRGRESVTLNKRRRGDLCTAVKSQKSVISTSATIIASKQTRTNISGLHYCRKPIPVFPRSQNSTSHSNTRM